VRAVVLLLLVAALLPARPLLAGFAYVPSERSLDADPEAARRLKDITLRWDRRIDTGRRTTDWRTLLFDAGLAWERHGDEVHVRPAGLPPGAVELAARDAWSVLQEETLRDALTRWSAMEGADLVWLTDRRWRLHERRHFQGTFTEAVSALAEALSGLNPAPDLSIAGRTLSVRHRPVRGHTQ